jgi:hypothetical protein
MPQLADLNRVQAAQADADRYGYQLTVNEALNMPAPLTHMAYANPIGAEGDESWGGFLCYGSSAADAAEAGAEIIRRHVELGEPWPEELLRPA